MEAVEQSEFEESQNESAVDKIIAKRLLKMLLLLKKTLRA